MNKLQFIKVDFETWSSSYPHYAPPCQLKAKKSGSLDKLPLKMEKNNRTAFEQSSKDTFFNSKYNLKWASIFP